MGWGGCKTQKGCENLFFWEELGGSLKREPVLAALSLSLSVEWSVSSQPVLSVVLLDFPGLEMMLLPVNGTSGKSAASRVAGNVLHSRFFSLDFD